MSISKKVEFPISLEEWEKFCKKVKGIGDEIKDGKLDVGKIIKPAKTFFGEVVRSGKIELPFPVDSLRGETHYFSRTINPQEFFHVSKKYKKHPTGTIVEVSYRESSEKSIIISKVHVVEAAEFVIVLGAELCDRSDFHSTVDAIKGISLDTTCSLQDYYDGIIGHDIIAEGTILSPEESFELWKALYDSRLEGKFTFRNVKLIDKEDEMPVKIKNEKNEADSISKYKGAWVDDKWIPEDVMPLVTALTKQQETGNAINILITGESGYGKTTLLEIIAKQLNMDFLRINCPTVIDTESWFGYQEARDGDTVFLPTDFTKAVVQGNCMIALDEANRIEPWIANSLFPILDYARETTVHGEHIVVGENVIFGLTMNIGSQFSGTYTYDQAMKNRIDAFVELDAPPFAIEKEIITRRYSNVSDLDIQKILLVLTELRGNKNGISANVSTRTALKIARLIDLGMDVRGSMFFSLVNSSEEIDRKEILDTINMKIGVS